MSAPDGADLDPLDLAARLIRCPSVTPQEGGAIALLHDLLASRGFECRRVDRGGVANLHARRGPRDAPTFGLAGHTDVVPPGEGWSVEPFGGAVEGGRLWGRGAADMKSAVAAMAVAAISAPLPEDRAVALLITGDEEGDAVDGTAAILDWMAGAGERLDACLVGEPTCPERLGEAIKIGRRGSITARITATGVQGHAAYPERALNPVPALARLVDRLSALALDEGTEHFGRSTLQVVTFDTGNPASNVIPGACRAVVNIRFNDAHSGASLAAMLEREAAAVAADTGAAIEVSSRVSGEAFVTEPGALSDLVSDAVEAETGLRPALSTTGGTSDARFLRAVCPVVEFGLVGATMHQADEHVEAAQVGALARIYERVLLAWAAS